MKRSRHCQIPGFRTQAAVLLTAAMGLSTAHAASPVKVIFSAENALYGAGYDIGRADGWYDTKLRAAVRNYQDKTGLPTSGELDSQTLQALGVQATTNAPISSNAVASRKDAVAALGIPEREPRAVAHTPLQKPAKSVVKLPEKRKELQLVTKETSTKVEVEVQPSEVPATLMAVSEPAADTSPAPAPETRIVDSASPANTKPVTAAEVAAVEEDDSLTQLPAVPGNEVPASTETETATTVAEQADSTSVENPPGNEPRRSTGGGFFSVLFDFFFGWLV